MTMESLVGLTLERFTFSRSSYSLEFGGALEGGAYRRFEVATSSYLSSGQQSPLVDAEQGCSLLVWAFLECTLINVSVDAQAPSVEFTFENGGSLVLWADVDCPDNLLVVKELGTDAWFTVL